MIRRIVLASALVAISASAVPALALNPQPLPPCAECGAFKFKKYKYNFLKYYIFNRYYLKRYAAR